MTPAASLRCVYLRTTKYRQLTCRRVTKALKFSPFVRGLAVQFVTVSDTCSFMSLQLYVHSGKNVALATRNGSESLQCPSVAKCSESRDVSSCRVTECSRRS